MPEATPPVAVHLGTHRPTVRAVRAWCGRHRRALTDHHVTPRTSWSALREAVPGLDWRSDKGRDRLREHLTADGPVLFSTAALLGPAALPRGGALFPYADAGIDALTAALAGTPWNVHLSLAAHADVVTSAWVATVRHGHVIDLDTFRSTLQDPSWVPLVERLVDAVGADRVRVHDATTVRTAGDPVEATAAVGRSVLASALEHLTGRAEDLPLADVAGEPEAHWSARQVEVALAALPHLRSHDERSALTRFVDRQVDDGGTPARPLTPAQEAELADRDQADLARLRDLVEVR